MDKLTVGSIIQLSTEPPDKYHAMVYSAEAHKEVVDRLARLTEENARLREYAAHKIVCDFVLYRGNKPCSCGLAALVKGEAK